MEQKESTTKKPEKKGMMNLLLNLVIPFIILAYFSKEEYLGEKTGLVIALMFPTIYFIYDWYTKKEINKISILSFVGLLIKGMIGLLNLPREYVAIERAAIPSLIAIALLVTSKTSGSLFKKMIFNKEIFDVDKIEASLKEDKNKEMEFDKTMKTSSYLVACSFFVSGIINYFVTQHFMSDLSLSYPEALANVMKWSLPINTVPCMAMMMFALWYLLKKLSTITGIETDSLFAEKFQDKTDSQKDQDI